MIGITKDKLFQKRLGIITKLKIFNKGKHAVENDKMVLLLLIATFIILTITNTVLVYTFLKMLIKL